MPCKVLEPKDNNIQTVATALAQGEVAGVPTETVYGLAASIQNEDALKKIFKIKERPNFDPLIVHVDCIAAVGELTTHMPNEARILMEKFWPGPLTLVLPKSPKVSSIISAGLDTVGVRWPQHPVALKVLKALGHPFAAPSANRFSQVSPTQAQHVVSEFPNENFYVLDGGPCEIGLESTVLGFPESGHIDIFRPGKITKAMIVDALAEKNISVRAEYAMSVASPGHMKNHYMPSIPLAILPDGKTPNDPEIKNALEKQLKKTFSHAIELNLNEAPEIAARELYSSLRTLSAAPNDLLWIHKRRVYELMAWHSVWDRISKASTVDLT